MPDSQIFGDQSMQCSAFSSAYSSAYSGNPISYEVRKNGVFEGVDPVGPGSGPLMKTFDTEIPTVIPGDRAGIVEVRTNSPPPTSNSDSKTEPGSYSPAYSQAYGGNADPVQDDDDVVSLEPGDYSVTVYLVDSQTGLRSNAGMPFDFGSEENGSGHLSLRILYDSDLWDQAYIYRTLKAVEGVPNANLHLEAIIKLEDYHSARVGPGNVFDPNETSLRQSLYYYEANDDQLVFTQVYDESFQFFRRVPKAGAAIAHEGSMFISNIVDGGQEGELGDIRWSSATQITPEMFDGADRYVPEPASNTPIAWNTAGNNVVGLSKSSLFHVRKENAYIRIQKLHDGVGVANNRASTSVSEGVYFVDEKGLRHVDALGNMDELRSLNHLIVREWSGTLDRVSVAYDGAMNALFVYNAEKRHGAILWFSSSRITEIKELPFTMAADGSWPSNWDRENFGDPLNLRSFFLQNIESGLDASTTALVTDGGFKPRILMPDYQRIRKTPLGDDRITTLDVGGDTYRTVAFYVGATGLIVLEPSEAGTQSAESSILQVIESSDDNLVGRRVRVVAMVSDQRMIIHPEDADALAGLPEGSKVMIGAPFFRWTGHPVVLQDEDGNPFAGSDYFRTKQFDSLGASYGFVKGFPKDNPNVAYHEAIFFVGDEDDPKERAQATSPSGDPILMKSGQQVTYAAFGVHGQYDFSLTPGLEVRAADLDFLLLGVIVPGKIMSSYRSRRSQ